MKSTTIREWLEWVPAGVWGDLRQDIPIVFFFNHLDIRAEIIFVSLDKPEHIKKLLSMQLTGAWFNEVRETPIEIVHAMDGRVDRFPPMRDGGPTWGGIIGDTNPPDTEHWLPKLERQIETIRQANAAGATDGAHLPDEDTEDDDIRKIDPADYLILHNPDALSPEAENLANLKRGRKWYERLARGKTQAWIDVYIHGKYGSPEEGRPVYPEFKATTVLGGVTVPWHVASGPLKPNRHLPLYAAWDYGITPVCILFQLLPTGQLAVLEEIIATKINPRGMGIKTLGTYVKKWILGPKYPDYKIISVGDPAGADPSQTDEKSCQDMLRAVGIPTRAAPTNLFTPRRQAVVDFLEGPAIGMPGMLIDPRCGELIEGFKGGYKYRRVAKPGEQRYAYEPEKNAFSHPHDALQYGCLFVNRRPRSGLKRPSAKPYEPADPAVGY